MNDMAVIGKYKECDVHINKKSIDKWSVGIRWPHHLEYVTIFSVPTACNQKIYEILPNPFHRLYWKPPLESRSVAINISHFRQYFLNSTQCHSGSNTVNVLKWIFFLCNKISLFEVNNWSTIIYLPVWRICYIMNVFLNEKTLFWKSNSCCYCRILDGRFMFGCLSTFMSLCLF